MSTHTKPHDPFVPPHCPNCECAGFRPGNPFWRYNRYGTFNRLKPPYTVQKYICKHCGRIFSDQTFKASYWLKCPELLPEVMRHAVSGASNCQIARILKCAPATVDNHLARLGRHCVLFHRQMLATPTTFVDIALDGLVTFEWSQYFPYEILTTVDRRSSFIIHYALAQKRRSGTMTDYQAKKRTELEAKLGKPSPKNVMKATVEVLTESLKHSTKATVWSDKHKTYPWALKRITWCEIEHKTIDSRKPRNSWNPLFEINVTDMLIRHCLKDHTRETIAFGKRCQHSFYRFSIFTVWRNYIKLRRERRCEKTPAMMVGLMDRRLTEDDVLSKRLFVHQTELTPIWDDYYWRRVETRALSVNRRHAPRYAA